MGARVEAKWSDWLNNAAVVKHFRLFGDAAVQNTRTPRETTAFDANSVIDGEIRKMLFEPFRHTLNNSEATLPATLLHLMP